MTQKSVAFCTLVLCLWPLDQIPTAAQVHHVIPNVLIYVHAYLFIFYLFMISIVILFNNFLLTVSIKKTTTQRDEVT